MNRARRSPIASRTPLINPVTAPANPEILLARPLIMLFKAATTDPRIPVNIFSIAHSGALTN